MERGYGGGLEHSQRNASQRAHQHERQHGGDAQVCAKLHGRLVPALLILPAGVVKGGGWAVAWERGRSERALPPPRGASCPAPGPARPHMYTGSSHSADASASTSAARPSWRRWGHQLGSTGCAAAAAALAAGGGAAAPAAAAAGAGAAPPPFLLRTALAIPAAATAIKRAEVNGTTPAMIYGSSSRVLVRGPTTLQAAGGCAGGARGVRSGGKPRRASTSSLPRESVW